MTVTVTNKTIAPTSLFITPSGILYKEIGDKLHVQATIYPVDATNKNITYTSSNNNVAIIDLSENLTVRGTGIATITVSTSNNISKSVYIFAAKINGIRQISVKHSDKQLDISNGENKTTLGTPYNHLVQKSTKKL
ncbi:Bacterial Ig-like domain (group 2) [Bacillus subtilis]|nr:Bacterial Ig-like domain (group 2) [Bacillus subtilis]